MTGGAWPGADVPAASQNETARPGDTAAGRATVPAGGRVRQASRRGWPWVWALASGVVAAAAVRVPGAAVAGLSRQRAGFGRAAGVLARTVAGLLADAGLLAACSGLPVPWRGLLFAYAAGQLAGRRSGPGNALPNQPAPHLLLAKVRDPGQPFGDEPGRPGSDRPGHGASVSFSSLIVRTWHHRPGCGPVRPDKEAP